MSSVETTNSNSLYYLFRATHQKGVCPREVLGIGSYQDRVETLSRRGVGRGDAGHTSNLIPLRVCVSVVLRDSAGVWDAIILFLE